VAPLRSARNVGARCAVPGRPEGTQAGVCVGTPCGYLSAICASCQFPPSARIDTKLSTEGRRASSLREFTALTQSSMRRTKPLYVRVDVATHDALVIYARQHGYTLTDVVHILCSVMLVQVDPSYAIPEFLAEAVAVGFIRPAEGPYVMDRPMRSRSDRPS
jgi:hypothetical protein